MLVCGSIFWILIQVCCKFNKENLFIFTDVGLWEVQRAKLSIPTVKIASFQTRQISDVLIACKFPTTPTEIKSAIMVQCILPSLVYNNLKVHYADLIWWNQPVFTTVWDIVHDILIREIFKGPTKTYHIFSLQ